MSRQSQRAIFFILVGLAVAVAVLFGGVPDPWKTVLLALTPLAVAAAIMFPARQERKAVFLALVFTAAGVTVLYLNQDRLVEWVAKPSPTPQPTATATPVGTAQPPMPPPTTTAVRVTPKPVLTMTPAPSGQIAFVRNWSIWVMGVDGAGERRLTKAGIKASAPAWSPDGKRLAYAVEENGTWQIWTMWADSSQPRRFTWSSGYWPTWSPDGQKIAYQSGFESPGNVMVASVTGGVPPVRLTHDPGRNGNPAWSPDGQYIAFVSDRSGTVQVWLMKANGSSPRQLTSGAYPHQHPAWSPDGRYLAYEKVLSAGLSHIYVMDMHSGESRLLNNGSFPTWSPDGRWLVVRMNRGSAGGELWLLRSEGPGVERLLSGKVYHFAWKR